MNFSRTSLLSGLIVLFAFSAKAQLSGLFTVPGSFPTLASAINSLNVSGVNGAVTINIAAGYTEIAIPGGYTLTATGTSSTPILFQRSGVGANPQIMAYSGGVSTPNSPVEDGVWRFVGSDYITIDGIDILDQNVSNPATMECGYCFYYENLVNGCQNNTIKNSTITLNRDNNDASNPNFLCSGSKGIEMINCYTQSRTLQTPTVMAGTNSYNRFYGNLIQNCNTGILLHGNFSSVFPDELNDIGGTMATTGNTIVNFGGAPAALNAANAIITTYQWENNISHNILNNNNGAGVNHIAELNGIYMANQSDANTTVLQNTITLKSNSPFPSVTGILNAVAPGNSGTATVNINENLITGCTFSLNSTGSCYGIRNNSSVDVLNINNNRFENNSSGSVNGDYVCVYNTAPVTRTININGNSASNLSLTANPTAVLFRVIHVAATDSACNLSISNNTIQNISTAGNYNNFFSFINSTASPTITNISFNSISSVSVAARGNFFMVNNSSSSASVAVISNSFTGISKTSFQGFNNFIGYDNSAGVKATTLAVSGNLFSNITFTDQNNFVGIASNSTGNRLSFINNNTISAISSGTAQSMGAFGINTGPPRQGSSINNNLIAGLTSGLAWGIEIFGLSNGAVHSNTIHSLNGPYGVKGISVVGYPVSTEIYKNRIFDLEAGNGGTVRGVSIDNISQTAKVFNNLIGDLRCAASGGAIVNCIYANSQQPAAKFRVFFNTMYLNTINTISGYNSSCVFAQGKLVLNNNILVNTSTGTGPVFNPALIVSSSFNALDSASNTNYFYTGPLTVNNQIYYTPAALSSFSMIQAYLSPREGNSVEESPVFLSTSGYNPNFLKLNSLIYTQAESGAIPISGTIDDYAGTIRNTATPDIGAWEGNYLLADSVPPTITGVNIDNSCNLSSITVTATIIDGTGVATGGLAPRCYYKINAGAFTSVQGNLTAGTINNGNWIFPLSYVANPGDILSWYVTAQDLTSPSSIGAMPSASFSATNVNTILTPPAFCFTTTLKGVLNGTYTVGSAGNFTTLTQAANAYNTRCLTGPVTFLLTDPAYSTLENFPVTFLKNPYASATFSLLVRPANGMNVAVTNLSTDEAVIKFVDARFISFDGINAAASLSLTNVNPGNSSVLWLVYSGSVTPGCKGIGLKRLKLYGGSTTSDGNNGIVAGSDVPWPYIGLGGDNDSISILNNTIEGVFNGIVASGSSTVMTGGINHWNISNNSIGPAVSGAANIGGSGMVLGSVLSSSLQSNLIRNITTSVQSVYGISLRNSVNVLVSQNTLTAISSATNTYGTNSIAGLYLTNAAVNDLIEKNHIVGIFNNSPSGYYSARGITINTGSPWQSSGNRLQNNMVTDIWSRAGLGEPFMTMGIALEGGTAGFDLDHNTVNLQGSYGNGYPGNTASTALYMAAAGGNIKLRNNILSNTYDNLSSTLDECYAVYSDVGPSLFTEINYNNYYVGGSASTLILAYINSTQVPNLSSWQSWYAGNLNSVNIAPVFTSSLDPHLVPGSNTALDNLGTPTLGIVSDIDNQPRSAVNPDMGADEFFPFACATLTPGMLNTSSITVCSGETFALSGSLSPGNGITYQWKTALSSGGPYTNAPGPAATTLSYSIPSFSAGVYYYVMETTCSSGSLTSVSNEATVTVNAPPTVTVTSNSPVCEGQTLTLNGSASSGALYNWSGPAAFSATLSNPVISTAAVAASGIYSLTVTDNSCSATQTMAVTVINPTVLVSNTGPYCAGTTIQLNTLPALSYTWTGPGGFYSNLQNPSITSATAGLSGTYSLTAEVGVAGCVASANSTVSVGIVFPVLVLNNSPVCPGTTLSFYTNLANSYFWNGPNSYTSNLQNPVINNVTASASGVYTITSTDANYCQSTSITSVMVSPAPNLPGQFTLNACQGSNFTLTTSGAQSYVWTGPASFFSPLQNPVLTNLTAAMAGNYAVIGSVGSCTAASGIVLNVNLTPQPILSSNAPICAGQSLSLFGNGAQNFQWTGVNGFFDLSANPVIPNVTTNATGIYTVVATSNFCSAIATLSVLIYPAPVLVPAATASTICAGEQVTLSVSGANSYTWNNTINGNQFVVSPTLTSSYDVMGTNSLNGCTAFTTVTLIVDECTGIENNPTEKVLISVYPNPTRGELFIHGASDDLRYQVINALGQMIYSGALERGTTKIDLGHISNGICLLNVYSNERLVFKAKIVKE